VNGLINFVPALAGKLTGRKVIWHLNDTSTPQAVKAIFLPFVRRYSSAIAVAAEEVSRYYFGNNGTSKPGIQVVYAPVDTQTFGPDQIDAERVELLRAELGISKSDIVVGTIGNINPTKGYEYFVKAAGKIASKVEDAKFIIVGAELQTQRRYFRKVQALVARYELQDTLVLAGFRQEIREILSLFDVFVLSSVREACPITVLEAMSMKVPVIATKVGGVPEEVLDGETGCVVEPRDPQAIASAVLELLEKPRPEIETMVNKGRQRAERIFSLDRIAAQHQRLYQQLCSPNHRKM
jgi:glycosyltransferase involved in cell wall biosynthesis